MAEYIERGAAIKCAEESYKMWCLAMAAADGEREINKCYKMQDVCKAIGEVFKIIPAADVAPVVHGKWLNFYNDFSCAECDRCGTTFEVTDNESDEGLWNEFKLSYNYCPNCGAKMDEEMKSDG